MLKNAMTNRKYKMNELSEIKVSSAHERQQWSNKSRVEPAKGATDVAKPQNLAFGRVFTS
jgi:hypothetical protein